MPNLENIRTLCNENCIVLVFEVLWFIFLKYIWWHAVLWLLFCNVKNKIRNEVTKQNSIEWGTIKRACIWVKLLNAIRNRVVSLALFSNKYNFCKCAFLYTTYLHRTCFNIVFTTKLIIQAFQYIWLEIIFERPIVLVDTTKIP